jgi:predicted nucleotidyltransferase
MATGKNTQLIYEELREYLSLLNSMNITVRTAYLFGSYAKGTADEWSDIDLALVTDSFIGDGFDFRFLLSKLARRIDSDIEPHPYLSSDFNERNPVANEIMKSGVLLL